LLRVFAELFSLFATAKIEGQIQFALKFGCRLDSLLDADVKQPSLDLTLVKGAVS
jgi:hypothetical protein